MGFYQWTYAPQVPPLLQKSDIDPEHCRVSAQLDDNVSQHHVINLAKSLEHSLKRFAAFIKQRNTFKGTNINDFYFDNCKQF